MHQDDIMKCNNYISSCITRIAAAGLILEIGSDFKIFSNAIEKHTARSPVTPKFNPDIERLDETNAFWMLGRNEHNEIVHTQAIRLMDIGNKTLAEHALEEFPNYTPPLWTLVSDMSQYRPGPGSCKIHGTICYHGDFWFKGGKGGFRGRGMNVLTSHLAMAMSLVKWNPDYIYAYMNSLVACSGVAARGGFMHMEQNNLYWSIPGYSELLETWMVWSSRQDILHLIGAGSFSLAKQLASSRPAEFDRKKRQAAA